MIRVRRATIVAIGVAGFMLGALGGWVQGQDSTKCAAFQYPDGLGRVCVTSTNGRTHAYDPGQERP